MTARADLPPLRARLAGMDVATVRAALWTARALRRTKRELARHGLDGARVAPPPSLPAHARRGVMAVIRRKPNTCLERALVLQRWEAAHGAVSDVVIGVPGRGGDFVAHAWLEHMPDGQAAAYHEIHRLPAPVD
ncbi:MAG TPA: lasso peptide biosynthesis B2 protein [Solirubrobacteraceae bacterium]|nr:lasso peptide biosynthesis B2 protein [Solirubrobacteraceae bacterium]